MGSVKPPGRLQDKVAIVTGSSSGLGRAISLRYAQEGAKVVCADLKPTARPQVPGESASTTIELIEQAGGEGIAVPCDVGKASDMESLVQKAVEKYGRLDVRVPSATLWGEDRPLTSGSIVNNAGIAIESTDPQPIHTTTEETWDTTMTVNAKSVFLGCKYAIAQMLKQDAHPSGDRGWIINVSSIYGLVGGGQNPSYSASKGAVSNLTRQISVDYATHNIHCNALNPGQTTKKMVLPEIMKKMYPFHGPGRPDDIAKMAVVLASDDASWMTGACVSVDGGYVARGYGCGETST